MIINSITLKNFRSYEDETTFSFSPKGDKNIILIGGENGAGKSTLFEAIKLCIYGPTTYGYLGHNYNYLTKIKNNINDNAFKNKEIDCSIGLSISFKEGTELKKYYLKRSWNYEKQKIHEIFNVSLNGKYLDDEDKLYFDKYLKSVLPPSLFDFFFFDGEELSEFFTGKSASANLKESVLELFNYDTFEILKKQLLSHQRAQSKSNDKLKEVQINFDKLYSSTNNIKEEIKNLEQTLVFTEEHLDNLLIKRNKVEEDFRNSGGILESEKAELNSKITKLENERIDINQYIKDFCNDTLPFLLVTDILKDTKEQIKKEEAINSYNSVKDKLSGKIIKQSLYKHNLANNKSDYIYNEVAVTILSSMFNIKELEGVSSILQLSTEQKNSINFTIDSILSKENLYKSEAINSFNRISEITSELKTLREKLNSTISGDILNNYLESIHSINKEITEIQNTIAITKSNIEKKQEDLKNKEYHLTRARNEYTTLLQNSSVLDMSTDLIAYLNELLINLTRDKINLIQNEFIKIFSTIIRKENYVNSIVIDENFNSTLYINKNYNTTDILNIIKNLGFDGVSKKYGDKFLEDLYNYYNVTTNKELEEKVINDVLGSINLSTKVNINDFSNGEKQIYILCLIWAIIKSSGVEIPFIIDTPYARIDETHRISLTTTYLPNISKQVIILSTNKEIDTELYKVIKPYVCDEYLLLYNTTLRKTEVKNEYFEV
ncbi:DNA sulfur modification protein DndD [Clostridium sporogenes]|uniref:DNA sulfur modification protein DndD n=1 Tax=Clostridium botulinum TaxID=1491 RepID=UPI000717AC76|nr:DNA sulfur modification protein DndD [Clostridium botulinum]KRU27443.1 DNA sulfur modification protein DndD [Clostridium sporogenes]KRU27797.1 DNA sulfur modification protein DndD [Clostridium sporogenes]KRU32161.1 DNA sulfur modification protein DndD [Clostridium sporogenes]KRU45025.1 DNA sulfur modification protein DndD [Clostridium sporogenes]MBZ1330254.1 DNA sulfur modification protein DndD [Clostridium botulinum]